MSSLKSPQEIKIKSNKTTTHELTKIITKLQNENIELRLSILEISKNISLISSTMAEQAIIQKFLVKQAAHTAEMVIEIDEILNPNSYIKFDLLNEPYN
jgi:hypothetical protein